MARHAIATEDKTARRECILDGARSLFMAGDGTLPSAGDIAQAAGLAKGTVYLYFRTKEEIFNALLMTSLRSMLDELEASLLAVKGRRAGKVTAFIAAVVAAIEARPELMRLDNLSYGVLEKNLVAETLRETKLEFIQALSHTAAVLEAALKITTGRGAVLLMRSFAMARGIWQSCQPCAHVFPSDELVLLLQPVFAVELTEALAEYWRGALAA